MYQLRSRQVLPISKAEAWDFLSSPENLKVITPEHMGFHILDGADRPMFPGQIIQYIVTPFPFFSVKWVTEITHVVQNEYFVDEQRFGPYALWHHKHFIKEVDGGVEMEDIVDYKLPLGFLGRLIHPILVKKQLRQIFEFREKKLTELFGAKEGYPTKLELKNI
ncbi:SRPBCC family protein [Flagellimonas allohymeniacidonis]|uniref:Cell division inhibitor n=1 Tax=Flagellimonas allohymeniacidonis TaxID=2517819 RepID=A0A4Q8QFI2_9FLAO|nr:SRPBCC family protein [Allomuricauda hymeniacidonis]TAI48624.1 cell division inhibitor [Allomuricauda hymeniacidonis]